MISTLATADDFNRWTDHAKTLSREALVYTMRDCSNAHKAMSTFNPPRALYYWDQYLTYRDELLRRY